MRVCDVQRERRTGVRERRADIQVPARLSLYEWMQFITALFTCLLFFFWNRLRIRTAKRFRKGPTLRNGYDVEPRLFNGTRTTFASNYTICYWDSPFLFFQTTSTVVFCGSTLETIINKAMTKFEQTKKMRLTLFQESMRVGASQLSDWWRRRCAARRSLR